MQHQELWHGKPYYSLNAYCRNTYGQKLSKIALNAGLSCPNRDGSLDTRGCIFCSAEGSGDFSVPLFLSVNMEEAIRSSLQQITCKKTGDRYIGYFQAFTNTYGPVTYLETIYRMALEHPSIAGISIATRPDCLPHEVLLLLSRLKEQYPGKFLWVELGLQTIHEQTAAFIRRGYPLPVFKQALMELHDRNIPVITHVILGLPGETKQEQLQTIQYLNSLPISGIKLQLLHILKHTDLATLYEQEPDTYHSYETLEEYLDILISALEHLRPDIVVHRVTGDANAALLLHPMWSLNKRHVLNCLHHEMKIHGCYQGRLYRSDPYCKTNLT